MQGALSGQQSALIPEAMYSATKPSGGGLFQAFTMRNVKVIKPRKVCGQEEACLRVFNWLILSGTGDCEYSSASTMSA